jgi:hypothetical protein
MRIMLKISVPVEKGNAAIQDGSLGRTISAALEELKPEAAYFFPENGRRTALMVVDLKDASQIPQTVERFFLGLDAAVDLIPVMNAADLRAGLDQVAKKRQ